MNGKSIGKNKIWYFKKKHYGAVKAFIRIFLIIFAALAYLLYKGF